MRLLVAMMLFGALVGAPVARAAEAKASSEAAKAASAKPDEDLFRSDAARVEMKKPKGWRFTSLESALANRAKAKMKDEDFQKAIEENASAPIMIVTKHEEPYDQLNPTIQLIVRPTGPLAGQSGVQILALVQPMLAQQFADFTVVAEPNEATVGKQTAGRMTMRYTLKTKDGGEFPTQATIVMIPKGAVLYQLGFSGPPEGDDAFGKELEDVLASVKFLE
jgi:hypothetical protein